MLINEVLDVKLDLNELGGNSYVLDSPSFKIKSNDDYGNHTIFSKQLGKVIGAVKLTDNIVISNRIAEVGGHYEGPNDIMKYEFSNGVSPALQGKVKFELTQFLVSDSLTRMELAKAKAAEKEKAAEYHRSRKERRTGLN